MALRKLRRRPALAGQRAEPNSLFGEILDWMLAPLMFLWPISVAVTHNVANSIADLPYDRALQERVVAIGRLVGVGADGAVTVNLPPAARALLQSDAEDTVLFQVRGPRGEIVVGDAEIPGAAPAEAAAEGQVQFRDQDRGGEELRVAYQFITSPAAGAPPLLIQVAETRNKREALASRIVSGVLLPQFAIIPIAVILVYFGLGRGIAPLARLQRMIQRRRPSDLSPISVRGMPEEVMPVINAFNDMMWRLEQNMEIQQRFIADAAHQMRTPLTGLKMQAELALSETDPELIHRFLQQINDSTDRAAHLINQLLALARAEATSEKSHAFEAVDLEELLPQIVEEFVPRALARHVDLGLERTGWPLVIDGNPVLLRELFKNLIDNALKYTPSGGQVTVRLGASDLAVVEVEDTGPGIPAAEREQVFERFYRVLGNPAAGSGLGLAIVREIAELHQARVSVDNAAGPSGALFRVAFPRHRQRAAEAGMLGATPQ